MLQVALFQISAAYGAYGGADTIIQKLSNNLSKILILM